MDWSGCDLVEVVPGKVSGKPIVRGTRIPADVIVSNYRAGLSLGEIHEDFPGVTPTEIRSLLDYANAWQRQLAS